MFEIFLIFLVGICVGSFLNVLSDRLPRNENILNGRSYCESCRKFLRWHDLIPLLSFILIKGRCRYCQAKLSWYYPLVELITGLIFVAIYFEYNQYVSLSFIITLAIMSALIAIFFADLKKGIIPDKIVFPTVLILLFYLAIDAQPILINRVLSAVGSSAFFIILVLATKGKGMGIGDVKLSFLLGLFLGFPMTVIGLYIAFLTGAVAGIILILWQKKPLRGTSIPFGPFLVLGSILTFFIGDIVLSRVRIFIGI